MTADRIPGMLSELAGRVSRLVSDPTADLTGTAFLLAAAVLVVLIVVLLMLVWVVGPAEPKRSDTATSVGTPAARRRSRRSSIALGLWAAVAVVLVAEMTAFTLADDTSTCLSCHDASAEVVKAQQEGPHASAACFSCHSSPGVFGGTAGRLQYSRWLAGGNPEAPENPAFAPDGACLECHADEVAEGVFESVNMRVKHDDFRARYACIDCHRSAGHEGYVQESPATMSRCLLCHDGAIAAASCETCHRTDISAVSGTPPDRFPKVEMGAPEDCRGCHEIESCNACHGLEMPHSAEFVQYAHAKDAAFGSKTMCFKCHSEKVFCNQCHRFPSGHPSDFKYTHGSMPTSGCAGCHSKSGRDFCSLCHGG